jgi:hypothetical protein
MQEVDRGDGLDYSDEVAVRGRFPGDAGALFLFLEPTTCPRFAFVRISSFLALFSTVGE